MDLLPEVLEEEGIHCPFEPDMELGDRALGDGDQRHAGEGEVLVERGDVLLVARQAVERFGHDHVEGTGAGVLEELLIAWAHADRAADRVIGAGSNQRPLLRLDAPLAQSDLVFDRLVTLKLGAVAGVDHGAHGCLLSVSHGPRGSRPRPLARF